MKKKFGTFQGVFVPSTEAILGTVLFLLMPYLAADVGLIPMLVVVLLAHTVTVATSFSLSDCATNLNNIEGGGLYALSKLSLGNAMGGSIGVQLYLAQAASIGFYCVGFARPLRPLIIPFLSKISFLSSMSVLQQEQILATIFLVIFFIVVLIGADFTLKLQIAILVILIGSIVTIFLSPLLDIKVENQNLYTSSLNLWGSRSLTMPIMLLTFTQFFPAVTGISTGIGMSGDLKNPKKSIVRGTFSAIFVTLVVYVIVTFLFSFMDSSILISGYSSDGTPQGILMTELFGLGKPFPGNIPGLMILLGVLFATSSSALSVFMTAPRTAQFMAKDNILPKFLGFMEKDFSKDGTEPRKATIVSFFIGLGIIWMGSLDTAAVVVGILFLLVYGWVNGAAFLERISKNPSFRPTFKSHWIISLYGFLGCIAAIILFKFWVGVAIFIAQFIIFQLILKYKSNGKLEGVWWGVLYSMVSKSIKRLKTFSQGARNWRPTISSYSYLDENESWKQVASLSGKIESYMGFVNLNILHSPKQDISNINTQDYLLPISVVETSNPTEVILGGIQSSNPSGIDPNTILLSYSKQVDNLTILKKILERDQNILLLANGEKLKDSGNLDIWWRGERNGNLMVLLAYILNTALQVEHLDCYNVRVIRKIAKNESENDARRELSHLLKEARVPGEVVILPHSSDNFLDTLSQFSGDSSLVLLGLPGNYVDIDSNTLFRLNDFFFNKEIAKYSNLPAILFMRCAKRVNLLED